MEKKFILFSPWLLKLKAQLRPYHAFGACCELLHFSLLTGTLQEIRGSGVVGFGFFGAKFRA